MLADGEDAFEVVAGIGAEGDEGFGTEDPVYQELGFVRDRQIAKWRWVMRRQVDA